MSRSLNIIQNGVAYKPEENGIVFFLFKSTDNLFANIRRPVVDCFSEVFCYAHNTANFRLIEN